VSSESRKKKGAGARRPATKGRAPKAGGANRKKHARSTGPGSFPARTSSAREDKRDEPLVRLNKYLADHGVASRRSCDKLIEDGKVTIDGEPVTLLGTKVDPTKQVVEIGGVLLKPERAVRRYYLLNKPTGVLCTNEVRETRPRAVDLITARDKGRIYTVGRLDELSKGLIILTNDGEFANRIAHPRYGVLKTYLVRVQGKIEDDAVQKLRAGVHLSDGKTGEARILVKRRTERSSTLAVTIREGKNREVRRIFARMGSKVIDLARTDIGPLNSRGLKVGHWRTLTRREVEELLQESSADAARQPMHVRRFEPQDENSEGSGRPGGAHKRVRPKTGKSQGSAPPRRSVKPGPDSKPRRAKGAKSPARRGGRPSRTRSL
jgi:23S rRNA pseudouridine2605 synthase